jgi:O-antigen/teichoic acid export membrane protein
LANRLDYVLIVNFGGLRVLGQYVAVTVVAATVPIVSGFFMDTLLPGLTNTIAARNNAGAAQVFTLHVRILLLVITAMSCAVMVLAVPATAIMGGQYASLGSLIILMTAVYGIASPGATGGTLLFCVGRQQLAVWVRILNLCLFACLFLPLWQRWDLAGAVVAFGIALVISNVTLMAIALRTAPIFPSISGLWLKAAAVQLMVSFVALWWLPLSLASAALTWFGAMVLFLWLAQYDWSELRGLAQTFSPSLGGRLVTSPEGSVATPVEPRVLSG